MLIFVFILSVILNFVFGYIVYNLLRKVEIYEDNIEEFYSRTSIVLHSMRALDSKKMFETDDEVGTVFDQLVDMLNSLRPILYGVTDDKKENRFTDS
jgi:hypothetical protein